MGWVPTGVPTGVPFIEPFMGAFHRTLVGTLPGTATPTRRIDLRWVYREVAGEGALYVERGTITLDGSNFTNCKAPQGSGGAVLVVGAPPKANFHPKKKERSLLLPSPRERALYLEFLSSESIDSPISITDCRFENIPTIAAARASCLCSCRYCRFPFGCCGRPHLLLQTHE